MDKTEKDELQQELSDLREQLETMKAERLAAEAAAEDAPEEAAGEDESDEEPEEGEDISSQLQDLTDKLDRELKDANPVTLLVVFAVGIFVGRLLPR